MADPPVVALVGPTGSGKSALALQATQAASRPVEVVAVDAFTVYRGMDVGTAKPGPAERAAVPHHMVDVLDVEQDCTVRWFQGHAREAIDGIRRRGAVPLLVGGSGLYFRTVVDPLDFPPTDAGTRGSIEERWAEDPAGAWTHLRTVDPAAADRIDPGNLRRTVRALEVLALTGRRFSEYRAAWDGHDSIYPTLSVVGVDVDRPTLAGRLAARTQRMLDAGWLAEVEALAGRALSETARQAIGYAELLEVVAGRLPLPDALARIEVRTRRFATRQQRWFAGDPRVVWTAPEAVVQALVGAIDA